MKHLHVDFSRSVGPVKPVNGLNNGPLTCNFSQDARPYYKEAHIPFARLHDTEYPFGSGEFVDVDCLFKVFSCDENDPASYNFILTDEYLKAICECGTKIIYRLGATIEHQPVKKHTLPPKDYMKWARICEHIIMHYNEGWADGLHLGIEYWEIWNEPELHDQCWIGTDEAYFEFYRTVVTYLKGRFPHLKFGGPACCTPEGEFARKFLQAISSGERAPLDFFSWHGYLTEPTKALEFAQCADALLKEFGYENAESIYDEWNYVKDWAQVLDSHKVISSGKGAALDAAVMIALQHSPCDISTYYDGQTKFSSSWCGLFNPSKYQVHGAAGIVELKKPYYAFRAFGVLRELGQEVFSEIEEGNVYVCAAAGDGQAVLLANYHDTDCKPERVQIRLDGAKGPLKAYKLCGRHNLDKIGEAADGDTISLPRCSLVLLTDREL